MANVNKPFGAKPIRKLDGSPYNGLLRKGIVNVDNATAIFRGDWIAPEATAGGRGIIPLAAGGVVNVLGVARYFEYLVDSKWVVRNYIPVTTAGYVYYAPAENTIFEMQEDGLVSSIQAADLMQMYDIIAGAGSTTTGLSGHVIDSSSKVVTKLPFIVLRAVPAPDNAISTTGAALNYCRFEVVVNMKFLSPDTGAILPV